MAIAMAGTAATTGQSAGASSHTLNLPSSIAAGEVIVVAYAMDDAARYLTATGWTDITTNAGSLQKIMYRVADGGEGATQLFNLNTGTAAMNGAVARRFTGVDTATPFGSLAEGSEASEDPFTLAADLITGLGDDDWVLVAWGGDPTADRAITTLDAALTLVGTSPSNRVHFAAETNPGAGNAAYSTDMASARGWAYAIAQLKAAAGASQAPGYLMLEQGLFVGGM